MRLVLFAVAGVLPLLSLLVPDAVSAAKAFRDGCWAYNRQQFPEAIAHFERAVQLDASNAEAWFYLGSASHVAATPVYRSGPAPDTRVRAREAYRQSVSLGLGGSAAARELQAEALAALAELLAADPNPDAESAVTNALGLVREFPGDSRALLVLARTYETLDRRALAEETYGKLAASYAADRVVCDAVAEFRRRYAAAGEQDDVLAAFERCAALNPNDPSGYHKAAAHYFEVAFRLTQVDDARRSVLAEKGLAAANRALALNPDYLDAMVHKMLLLRVKARTTRDPELRRRSEEEAAILSGIIQERRQAISR